MSASTSGFQLGRRSIWDMGAGWVSTIGESRRLSWLWRFDGNEDTILSVLIRPGSSDTVLSARACLAGGAPTERLALLVVDTELPFFGPKDPTLPNTPVTPPRRAFPPPATSLGALLERHHSLPHVLERRWCWPTNTGKSAFIRCI